MPSLSETLALALQRHQSGDLQAAEQIYLQILSADPNQADALHLLGVIASQAGRHALAVEYISRAIQQNGAESLFHCNLGAALKACGKDDEALASFLRALELNPNNAEAHYNLGATLQLQDKLDAAVACFRRALELKPDYVEAHVNLGNVLQAQQKSDEAIDCYLRALEQKPDNAETHYNLGNALQSQGKLDAAVDSYRHALHRKPGIAKTHYNLGNAYKAQGKLAEAVSSYRRTLEADPSFAEAHANLGATYQIQGQLEKAEEFYRRALKLKPDFALAHSNHAMLRLLLGDFRHGWPEYEWRGNSESTPLRQFSQPIWDGSPLVARTILLQAEQGFGDTLQFVRYAALLKKQNTAATVIVHCQPPLEALLARCPGMVCLSPEVREPPPFHVYSRLLSIPNILQTTIETIPAEVPYLFADPTLVAEWCQRLAKLDGLRIGINWQGRAGQGEFKKRNIHLQHFADLARLPGVNIVSLQKGEGRDELLAASDPLPIHDLGADFDTTHGAFMDTAAVMMNLDLVITSDTSVAHLAGALGVPAWVALPTVPDWRWLLDRADSPWYPTMRLFRQKTPGDWTSVFDEIRAALHGLLSGAR